MTYTFSDFKTGLMSPEVFEPPEGWLGKCTDSDGGIRKTRLPDRQSGYVCVSPSKNNSFSLALLTKPQHKV